MSSCTSAGSPSPGCGTLRSARGCTESAGSSGSRYIDGLITADPAVYVRLPKVHADETRTQGLDRLELIRFLQRGQTGSVHHGALAYLRGINNNQVSA